jgi:hypothetical protein
MYMWSSNVIGSYQSHILPYVNEKEKNVFFNNTLNNLRSSKIFLTLMQYCDHLDSHYDVASQ